MDGGFDLFGGCLEIHGQGHFGDELSSAATDYVSAKNFSVFLVEDHFHKTFGLRHSKGAATRSEWELTDGVVEALLFAGLFG